MGKKLSIQMYKLFTALFVFACILFITHHNTATAATLSQQEKEELHQQYREILEEVKATYTWGEGLNDVEVCQIDEFEEEDWVSLEVFKQRAIERVQSSVVEMNPPEIPTEWFSEEIVEQQAFGTTQVNDDAALANSITPLSTTSATHHNTASATPLSQQEKEELHQQYREILEEVKATYTWGEGLGGVEVSQIDEFEEEDWVSLEEFKQRAIEVVQFSGSAVEIDAPEIPAEWFEEEIVEQQAFGTTQVNAVTALANSITPLSTTSATRIVRVLHHSTPVNIEVSAGFTTQLSGGRQVLTSYSDLRTTAAKGTFTHTGVDASIERLGTTYRFTIGGELNYVGFTTYHTLNTIFLCLPTGVVI